MVMVISACVRLCVWGAVRLSIWKNVPTPRGPRTTDAHARFRLGTVTTRMCNYRRPSIGSRKIDAGTGARASGIKRIHGLRFVDRPLWRQGALVEHNAIDLEVWKRTVLVETEVVVDGVWVGLVQSADGDVGPIGTVFGLQPSVSSPSLTAS